MSDVLRVRDHTQPCEHAAFSSHSFFKDDNGVTNRWVPPSPNAELKWCPGGREIVLRQTTIKDMRLKADTPVWVEVNDE